MPVITYILTRTSPSFEKLALSATMGLLFLSIFSPDFSNFKPEYLIISSGYSFQANFLLYSLFWALVFYATEIVERAVNFSINVYFSKKFDFIFEEKISIQILREETVAIDTDCVNVIKSLYVLLSIMLIIYIFLNYGTHWLEGDQGVILLWVLIFLAGTIFLKILTFYINIIHHSRLTLFGYGFFYKNGSDEYLNLARRSSWTEIKTRVASENNTLRNSLVLRNDAFLGQRLQEYFQKEESKDQFYNYDINSQIQAGLGGYKGVFTINPKEAFREDKLRFYTYNRIIQKFLKDRVAFNNKIDSLEKKIKEKWQNFIEKLNKFNESFSKYIYTTNLDLRDEIVFLLLQEINADSFEKNIMEDSFNSTLIESMQENGLYNRYDLERINGYIVSDPFINPQYKKMLHCLIENKDLFFKLRCFLSDFEVMIRQVKEYLLRHKKSI